MRNEADWPHQWFYFYVNGVCKFRYENVFDSAALFYVFQRDEVEEYFGDKARAIVSDFHLVGKEYHDYDEPDYPVILVQTTAKVIKDRLKVLGYGSKAIGKRFFEQIRNELIEEFGQLNGDYKTTLAELKSFNYDSWITSLKTVMSGIELDMDNLADNATSAYLLSRADENFALATLLSIFDDNDRVIFDFSDYSGKYFYDTIDRYDYERMSAFSSYCTPILITEGSYDVRLLKSAIDILYPYLANYIRFMDLDIKPDGGANPVAKMIVNFAAAGLSNRILTIFDNDTAGQSALKMLRSKKLPSNYGLMCLPTIELLEKYPTKGPQGDIEVDINGMAGSMEMYWGKDVLTDKNGNLTPIVWTDYVKAMDSYQGSLSDTDKKAVQARIRAKINNTRRVGMHDKREWRDLEYLIESTLNTLAELAPNNPQELKHSLA